VKSVKNLLLSVGIICMCMMQIHCSKGPSNADYLTFKAEMFMRSGELDRAQEELSKALLEDAKSTEANIVQSKIYVMQNLPEKAIASLQSALESNPKSLDALYSLGFLYTKTNEFQKAIDQFNKALEVKPDTSLGYNNLGVAYHSLKQYDKAIVNYKKAIEKNPKFVEAFFNIGNSYVAMNDMPKAIESYNRVIQLKPDYVASYLELASCFNRIGNPAEAGNNTGLYYYFSNKLPQAIDAFSKVVAANPNYAVAYHNMGASYDKLGNREKTIEYFQKAAKLGYAQAQEICKKNNIAF